MKINKLYPILSTFIVMIMLKYNYYTKINMIKLYSIDKFINFIFININYLF